MRAYTVATIAVTLGVPAKWLDNVLTHHTLAGVAREKQGIPRRLTERAVVVLAIALDLTDHLRLPLAHALDIASKAESDAGSDVRVHFGPPSCVELVLNLRELRAEISDRLDQAVEIAPVPRRGRPPRRIA